MHSTLADLVSQAKHLVAFTGAGVSTLSGLPDFRGRNGVYNNPDNQRIFDIDVFYSDPGVYYRSFCSALYEHHDIPSSLVHNILAEWESLGILHSVITQNIDALHQKAGSRRVIEVHGSPLEHHCLVCGAWFAFDEMRRRVSSGDIPPRCGCGGFIKPDITFFGESLPQDALRQAQNEAQAADVMLVLGTSLTVQPAASLPLLCHRNGGKLILINDQSTGIDDLCALRLWDLEKAFASLS